MGNDLLACHANSFAQSQPCLNATFFSGDAIMIKNTLHPFAPHVPFSAVSHDGSILDRDCYLVVKTVCHPTVNLFTTTLSAVHGYVKRMIDVIKLSFLSEFLFKLLSTPGAHDDSLGLISIELFGVFHISK